MEQGGLGGAAVAVADPHGELIAFLRTDGCRPSSITLAMNKAYTAAGSRSRRRTWARSWPPRDSR